MIFSGGSGWRSFAKLFGRSLGQSLSVILLLILPKENGYDRPERITEKLHVMNRLGIDTIC